MGEEACWLTVEWLSEALTIGTGTGVVLSLCFDSSLTNEGSFATAIGAYDVFLMEVAYFSS